MKNTKGYILRFCVAITLGMACSSCVNTNRLFYDDDEWSYGELGIDDQSLMNSEIELDDLER